MGKAAEMMDQLGDRMASSIGVRNPSQVTGGARDVIPMSDKSAGRKRNREAGLMDVNNIVADEQVRKIFDQVKLEELAGSVREHGILSPIEVEWNEERGKHVIVAGERRFRAAMMAGLTEVPCVFKDQLPEGEKLVRQIIENLQREDLTPMEQANAFRNLADLESLTEEQVAVKLSVSQGLVSQRLALLKLPEAIQEHVSEGKLSAIAAYNISQLKTVEEQLQAATQVIEQKLNRAETQELIKKAKGKPTKSKPGRPVSTKTFKLENGATVTVKARKKRVTDADWIAYLEEAIESLRAA